MNTALNHHPYSGVHTQLPYPNEAAHYSSDSNAEYRGESRRVETPTQRETLTRMTEVIIPQTSNSNTIIFPLVASMTQQTATHSDTEQQERWLTWITDRKPDYKQLKHFGANAKSLRIIHIDKRNDNRWIIWDALNTGNSHTVIADINAVDNDDIEQMELAADAGKCTGMLIRSL